MILNPRILHKDVQRFIMENQKADLHKVVLKGSPFEGLDIREIAEQIQSRSKCVEKLPTWLEHPNIYFPNKISIEQSSSEITASYKANLFNGEVMADLTGGFGVDCHYFCKSFGKVFHCEMQESLSQIVQHNSKVLNTPQMECIHGDGLEFALEYDGHFDLLYADPARRGKNNAKVFLLQDCEPNIVPNVEKLLRKSDRMMVKLSPVLDISSALRDLRFVSEVRVVAVRNEVKELLFVLDKTNREYRKIVACNFQDGKWNEFVARFPGQDAAIYTKPLAYLYEPNAAILKAGLFNEVSRQLNIGKLQANSHLYTSNELLEFPGRSFEIIGESRYSPKRLKKQLQLQKANITVRNFQESVAQIRKRTGIAEGGDDYLFFTTDLDDRAIVLHCRKIA